MKKKIASLLIAAAMVLGACPVSAFAQAKHNIWVGGVQVTAQNSKDVLGDGTVSFDGSTNTLILNGLRMTEGAKTGDTYYGIYAEGDLNIVVKGNNSIYLDDEDKIQNGIKAEGSISIYGDGDLSVRARGASAKGIYSGGSFFVEYGVKVFAAGIDKEKAEDSGALWAKEGITLDKDVFECYEYSKIIEYVDEEAKEKYCVFSYDGESPVSRIMLDTVDEYYAKGENPDDKVTMYKVNVLESTNGKVNVLDLPLGGGNVRIEFKPDYGYVLDRFELKDSNFRPVEVKEKGEGVYSFVMPDGNVYVNAKFIAEGIVADALPFTDADENEWYGKAVRYVYENDLIAEPLTDKFSPDENATRGMIVSMLWKAEGMPVAEDAGFGDVKDGAYYKKAVDWAKAVGVTAGYGSAFGPEDSVTREQMVSMLYRYAVLKGIDVSVGENTNILSYEDAFNISEYAFPAMQWACGSGIISGDGAVLFPQGTATRAQLSQVVMMFLSK